MALNFPDIFGVRKGGVTKEKYMSIGAASWIPLNPDVQNFVVDDDYIEATGNGIIFTCALNLPHGAIVTSIIVYGNAGATGEGWYFRSGNLSSEGSEVLGSANFGSADTTITSKMIDNINKFYALQSTTLDAGDRIWGGLIVYSVKDGGD